MRIRTIKPEFFVHDGIAALPPLTRILFIGLWCLADCAGRLQDRPARIKVEILPYDEIDPEKALQELANKSFILRYQAAGEPLIEIPNFNRHQRITGREAESESRYPAYHDDFKLEPTGNNLGNNGETPGKQPGRQEGKGREGKGKEVGKTESSAEASPTSISDSDWIESLKSNPAYQGIDVAREQAKMSAWCSTNRKQPTRRRFINWLNRCDRPLQSNSTVPPKPASFA